MKAFIDNAIRFWLFFAIGCGIFASADDAFRKPGEDNKDKARASHEKITFLNFSDDPVQLYWVNTEDPDQKQNPVILAYPYQSYTMSTFSEHVFAYTWEGSDASYTAEQTTKMYVDAKDAGDIDSSTIKPQIHVLGDIDQLSNPDKQAVRRKAQNKEVVCGTTQGDIHIVIKPFWSPMGAARFLELLEKKQRYYNGCALTRVVPKFLTQFGISSDYDQRTEFRSRSIPDDPPLKPPIRFRTGYMSYAGSGADSRSTEIFVVMPDAPKTQLDYFGTNSWETPFGYVEKEDLDVVARWHTYGDMGPWGNGPDPQRIYEEDGYEYLKTDFPKLDYIKGCVIIPDDDVKDPTVTRLSYDDLAVHVFGEDEDEEEL